MEETFKLDKNSRCRQNECELCEYLMLSACRGCYRTGRRRWGGKERRRGGGGAGFYTGGEVGWGGKVDLPICGQEGVSGALRALSLSLTAS
jgi:hypothetical protein